MELEHKRKAEAYDRQCDRADSVVRTEAASMIFTEGLSVLRESRDMSREVRERHFMYHMMFVSPYLLSSQFMDGLVSAREEA